jgi:hypothetical protein
MERSTSDSAYGARYVDAVCVCTASSDWDKGFSSTGLCVSTWNHWRCFPDVRQSGGRGCNADRPIMAATSAISRLSAPSVLDVYLFAGALLIMGVTLAGVVAQTVFAQGRVTHHRIIGAILVYLSAAVIFTALFTIIGLLVPNAFSGMTFDDNPALASKVIYFSFVTLTSTGYGDVFPVHPVARSLCNLETIIGQLYPATLLARLVSLEIEGRR